MLPPIVLVSGQGWVVDDIEYNYSIGKLKTIHIITTYKEREEFFYEYKYNKMLVPFVYRPGPVNLIADVIECMLEQSR